MDLHIKETMDSILREDGEFGVVMFLQHRLGISKVDAEKKFKEVYGRGKKKGVVTRIVDSLLKPDGKEKDTTGEDGSTTETDSTGEKRTEGAEV